MKAGRSLFIRPRGRPARLGAFAVAALIGSFAVIAASPAISPESSPVKEAKISQAGRSLVLQVRTERQVDLKSLERQPDLDRPRATYLCFELTATGRKRSQRVCLGGKHRRYHRVGVATTDRKNRVYKKETVNAKVKRVGNRRLTVTLDPSDIGLRPGALSWRVLFSDGDCRRGDDDLRCRSTYPARHPSRFELLPVKAVGCTGGNGQVVRRGPTGRPRVALTFDDGPSDYTGPILDILERKKAKATFFVLGQQTSRFPALARRILDRGHELANHSTAHAMLPSGSDIRNANSQIKRHTGFRPCLFRPPYGATNAAQVRNVKAAKMKTVLWDKDTSDWRRPGTGSIASIIAGSKRGSIVLMHDGGGPREQTVAALSKGIDTLRRRGFELVTVTELLGNELIYRPRR